MKRYSASLTFLVPLSLSLGLACSKKDEGEADPVEAKPATAAARAATNTASDEVTPPIDAAEEPAKDRLKMVDFPNTKLEAEVGQYIFSPNDSSFTAAHEGSDKHRLGHFSWGIHKVEVIGDVETEVSNMGSKYKIPNAYLLPIPKESAIEVGDLVATSKYGNDLSYAYVMEVGDKVKANFIHTMPYGDKSADLKANRFFKITGGMQPGAHVGIRMGGMESKAELAGTELKVKSPDVLELFTLLRVVDDKVLLTGHMGKILVSAKDTIVEIPLRPEVKKGDKVFAVWDTLHFREGVLSKVDTKLGHYEVVFGSDPNAKKVPFGTLLAGTPSDFL